MRLLVEVFIPGAPKTKGSLDITKRGYATENVAGSKEWRRLVSYAVGRDARRRGNVLASGEPIAIRAVCWVPRPSSEAVGRPWWQWLAAIRPRAGDVDKLARNLLDACGSTDKLDAQVYADDNQVVRLFVDKVLCAEGQTPGALITIMELDVEDVTSMNAETNAYRTALARGGAV